MAEKVKYIDARTGAGSVPAQAANGLWEWQIMVDHYPGERRKMKSFYARTQKEVKEKAAKYLEDLRAAPQISKEMLLRRRESSI